ASVPDPAVRRYVVQALRGWIDPRAASLLEQARSDTDFGVRAEAYRSIAAQDRDVSALLREALGAESDRFVRRAIVEGLGAQGGPENALAIVAFLESALADRDRDGVETANLALMAMTGRPEYDSVPGWRQYLRSTELPRSNEGRR
ncbi:MAG: HEAT repeat domain-containing protein, partial [Planctomycetota bacterium]